MIYMSDSNGNLIPFANDNQGNTGWQQDLLWENSTPTVAIDDQYLTISEDMSQYKYFVVYYKRAIDYTMYYNTTIIPADKTLTNTIGLFGVFGYITYCRNIYLLFSTNEIRILNCYKQTSIGSGQTDNEKLVPLKVYGIK